MDAILAQKSGNLAGVLMLQSRSGPENNHSSAIETIAENVLELLVGVVDKHFLKNYTRNRSKRFVVRNLRQISFQWCGCSLRRLTCSERNN